MENKRFSTVGALFLYIALGLGLIYQYQSSYHGDTLLLFIVLIISYFWIGALLVHAKAYHNLYIFEPIFFVSMLYFGIFILKPIIDLKNGAMYEHGVNVLGGGLKATSLIVLSYTVMFLSYYKRHVRFVVGSSIKESPRKNETAQNTSCTALYIGWGITFGLSILCMLSQGLSLQYIFSLGTAGERVIDESNTVLLFLSNFGITTVTLWLMILVRSNNLPAKIVVSILEVTYILIRNGRWLILVLILSPIVFYYVKRRKKPNPLYTIIIAFLLLFVFAWMQANRYSISTGGGYSGWGGSAFSIELLLAPFESDLNTYRSFYSMVQRFPSKYPYMLGKTFFYVFVLFIPRAIWPGKPDNPVRDMIEMSLSSSARASGTATCNVGEIYANFGFLGCIFGMYIVGWVLQAIKSWYDIEKNIANKDGIQQNERLFMYSIIYPLLFQWIARGNFSGNFYMTLFALLPFIMKAIRRKVRWGGK